jgi:ankyrin repeat protein
LRIYDFVTYSNEDINSDIGDGNTELFIACRDGFSEVVKFLIKNGADIEHENDVGMTPIFYCASEIDEIDTLLAMINGGANLYAIDDGGDNLLQQVITMGSPNCAEFLLLKMKKIDPFAVNNNGKSAIDLAKENGMDEIFKKLEEKWLIEKGGDVSGKARDRM